MTVFSSPSSLYTIPFSVQTPFPAQSSYDYNLLPAFNPSFSFSENNAISPNIFLPLAMFGTQTMEQTLPLSTSIFDTGMSGSFFGLNSGFPTASLPSTPQNNSFVNYGYNSFQNVPLGFNSSPATTTAVPPSSNAVIPLESATQEQQLRWVNHSGIAPTTGLNTQQVLDQMTTLYEWDVQNTTNRRMQWLDAMTADERETIMTEIAQNITYASQESNIDENLLLSLFYQEGGLQPGFKPSGAFDDGQASVGMAQIIAPTASFSVPDEVGVSYDAIAGGDVYADVTAGARHLANFLDYDSEGRGSFGIDSLPKALRAYNSGPNQVGTEGPEYFMRVGDPQYLEKISQPYWVLTGQTLI